MNPFRRVAPLASVVLLLGGLAPALHAEVIDVDREELARLVEEGVPVVDIRLPEEWRETGVIEGSHLLTFFDADGEYDAAAWKAALDEIVDADEPVVLICRTGSRSGLVSDWLSERAGHATVYDVEGGIMSWLRSGEGTVAP